MSYGRMRHGDRPSLPTRMRRLIACSLLVCPLLASTCPAEQVGVVSAARDRTVLIHSDGTYEHAYAWSEGGCISPDYGSFAERYEGCHRVESIVLDLTSTFGDQGPCDIYLWDEVGGMPGLVLGAAFHVVPSVPAWVFTRNIIEFPQAVDVAGTWWIGYWGDWPLNEPYFYVGADLNGPGGGRPMTKIAPGQGYPEGWQDVSIAWGPTAALGIGAVVEETPSPVESETWGAIKSMFRR
jgi:hypothetical protein